jgi:RNA polymerase sigma-70 factor, ECF subfamily
MTTRRALVAQALADTSGLPIQEPAPCERIHACVTIRRRVVAEANHAIDLTLIRRIVARDETAVAELYDRHSRMVYSLILRILRAPADAEDVLQEVFVRVWTRGETYDERLGSPAAWLARIARNRAIDRFRSKRSRPEIEPASDAPVFDTMPSTNPADNPETLTAGMATASAIREAIATLPEGQRTLIEAAFFEGYTHQELSSRLGVPLGTVKTRIRTGLMAMRERLEHRV